MAYLAITPQALATGLWTDRTSMARALVLHQMQSTSKKLTYKITISFNPVLSKYTRTISIYYVNNELYVMYHRRLINPFLHFKLSKCTKYEIVSWMALRDTFGNTGTNLHTATLHTNVFQALLKTLWRKQDFFLPGQILALQTTSVLTYVKQMCGFLSSVCIQMKKHGICVKWSACTNFVGIIYRRCQNLEYWSYRSWICKYQENYK